MPPADDTPGDARGGTVGDDPAALRDLAAELAVAAGRAALTGRRASARDDDLEALTKSSRTDIVTRFDREAEETIVGELTRRRPGDAIVGEEGAQHAGRTGYSWLIDPIDGTTNFVYDLPAWCCSIAVTDGTGTVAGAVYVPVLDELYAAARGAGATLDGRPIAPSTEDDLARALVGTGFSYLAESRRSQAELVTELIGEVRDIRRMGSAAVDLCFVAAGRLDVYFEQHLNPWDMAAGELIASEAGAITSDFEGGTATPERLLVAAPGLHRRFVELLHGR